jgi:hypothetical protein
VADGDVGQRLLAAIAARDGAAIAACFAEGAVLRVLSPRGLREDAGPAAVAARYAYWFENLDGFEVLEAEAAPVADRVRLRYLVRGRHPEHGWWENEHTAYARVEDGLLSEITLTCTGFRPAAP